MTERLEIEAAADAALREALLREFPTLAEDEPTLTDTLDGISDFPERCRAIICSHLDDKAMVAALAIRIDEMQARKSRLDERLKRKKALVQAAMQAAGRKRFEFPEATLTMAKGRRRVIITDADAVPDIYCRIERTPDKTVIHDEIEAGGTVAGAELSNAEPTLSVRGK